MALGYCHIIPLLIIVHIAINIISLSIYIYTQSPCTKLYLLLYSCVEDHSQKSPQFFDL